MFERRTIISRRRFVGGIALGAAAFTVRGAFAEELTTTPPQTEGPFYPDKLPLDTDNDLLIVNDSITPAVGEITHLTGRVLSPAGEPIRNAAVEIWQCDQSGIYLHSASPNRAQLDANFQGFGRFLTNSRGEYYFRTIKPVPYAAGIATRTPHIHFQIRKGGQELITTQMYIKGHPLNEDDFVFKGIEGTAARNSVLIDFVPIEGSRAGELSANFDIVLGATPADKPKAG